MPPPSPLPSYVYKILSSAPPSPLPAALPLSALDASDGFIHLSTAAQTPATAARFFEEFNTLYLLQLPLNKLGSESKDRELVWEDSKNHGCFAHLYGGGLGKEEVEQVLVFERGEGGWEETLKDLEE